MIDECQSDTAVSKLMDSFMDAFKGKPVRLKKYMELMLLREDASPYSYLAPDSIRRIAVVLTTKCNLKCVWCHRNETSVQDYLHQEMEYNNVLDLLKKLQGFNVLHWAGLGEPLMYPRLFELTREARKLFSVVKLTTNGTLLTRDKADELMESGLNYLEVSIDGFSGNANKDFRGVDENKIIESLEYISANTDIPIQVNSVISKNNYDALFDAVDKLHHIKNIHILHTIPLFMTDHMKHHGIEPLSQEAHHDLLEHWRKRLNHFNRNLALFPDIWGAQLDPVISLKRKHNICFNCYEDPFINVNGALAPCGRLQHISLVDMAEHEDFNAAWNAPGILRWRESHLHGNYSVDCQRECCMKKRENER